MKRILFLFVLIPLWGMAQTQIGETLEGTAWSELYGSSISLSADGTVVAIGAPDSNSNGTFSGRVQVFENTSGSWTQIGQDIPGANAYDRCGYDVALSADGSIVAIGSPFNSNENGNSAGQVRIFQNTDGNWTQVGQDIHGITAGENSGSNIALSADGTIVAIGADGNNVNGNYSGQVRVYQNIEGDWTQVGQNIDGEAAGDRNGYRVSLSADGTVLAVAAPFNNGNGTSSGRVRVYQNIDNIWTPIGQSIDGEGPSNQNGSSIALNSQGNVIAIASPNNSNTNGALAGRVRVFEFISGSWQQVGQNIDGEETLERFGRVTLSSDGSILAVGVAGNNTNGTSSGALRIFKKMSNVWTPIGESIFGESAYDQFGISASLSSDGEVLAVGAVELTLNVNGFRSGYVKVYDLSALLSSDSFVQAHFTVYPNPVSEVLNIEVHQALVLQKVIIYNNLGQQVKATDKNSIDVSSLSKGVYFVEVHTNSGKATKKVIVK